MIYIIICLIIIIMDQFAKHYFNKKLKLGSFKEIIKDELYVANVRNTGAAYGILNKNPILLKIISVSALFYVLFNFKNTLMEDKSKTIRVSLAFVLGGALSNIFDRFKKKFVTDYIYINIKKWPVFNIADLFILFGSVLSVVWQIISFFSKKK